MIIIIIIFFFSKNAAGSNKLSFSNRTPLFITRGSLATSPHDSSQNSSRGMLDVARKVLSGCHPLL